MNIVARMVGAARLDPHAYEDVEADSGATVQALAVVILVAIFSGVGEYFSNEEATVANAVIIGGVRGIVWWVISAFFLWIIGSTILRTAGTEANWGQLARTIGFAQTPGLFNVLVVIPAVGGLIAFAVFIWSFIATLVAVRQALDYASTWRAFFAVLLAWIPTAVVYVIVILIIT